MGPIRSLDLFQKALGNHGGVEAGKRPQQVSCIRNCDWEGLEAWPAIQDCWSAPLRQMFVCQPPALLRHSWELGLG